MTKEEFLKDVSNHSIEILNDNGIYRHLRFSNNGSNHLRFDLVAWPGYLCVTGDMGEWVFSRTHDMFQFFGCDIDNVNLSYWAEKCLATGQGRLAIKEYSAEKFREIIKERLADLLNCIKTRDGFGLVEAVEEDVLSRSDNEHDAREAVDRFNNTYDDVFPDFWETDLTEFTPNYIWICHAIVWGIAKYHDEKTLMQQASNAVGANQAVWGGQMGKESL